MVRSRFEIECVGQVFVLVFGDICRLAGAERSDADPKRLKNRWEFFYSFVLNFSAIVFSRFDDSGHELSLFVSSVR
jgi:hypothetical protein